MGSRREQIAPGFEEHVNLLDTLETQGSRERHSSEHPPGGSQRSRSESPLQQPLPTQGRRIRRPPLLGRRRRLSSEERKALAERCKKAGPWVTAGTSIGAVCLAGAALAISAAQLRNERLSSFAAMMNARAAMAQAIHAGAMTSNGRFAVDDQRPGTALPGAIVQAADYTRQFTQDVVYECRMPWLVWNGMKPTQKCLDARKRVMEAGGPSGNMNEVSTGQVGVPLPSGPSRKMKGVSTT